MALSWYVVRTKPQSDALAASAMERDGIERFFPKVRTPKMGPGRSEVPLFPGYLFVRYDFDETERPSLGHLPGVLGWVRFNGHVPSIPDEIIDDIARRMETINNTGGLWRRFRRGEQVRVVSGKMERLAQVVEEPETPQSRVRVLLEFMGRLVPAQVPWQTLRPVQDTSFAEQHYRGHRRTRGKGRWVRGFGPRQVAGA